MIICLFGQPSSGKTTLAKAIQSEMKPYSYPIVDGDEVRALFGNHNYDQEGRKENLSRVTTIAVYCEQKYGTTIVSAAYPYQSERQKLQELAKDILWVRLINRSDRGKSEYQIKDFEDQIPLEYNYLEVDTTEKSIEMSLFPIFLKTIDILLTKKYSN
jgi:GTPase SAR1 family protein